jgi:hypothetical protein
MSTDFTGENPFGESLKRQWLTDLENRTQIWNTTDELRYIAWVAACKRISPWGLLAIVQQHRASWVDPTHVLVDVDGMPGATLAEGTALSGYVGLVGVTGGGKNVIFRAATAIIPPFTSPIPTGTGQGLVKSFAETVKVTDGEGKDKTTRYATQFSRHVTVVHADEIDALNAEFARDASSTDAMMRSLWTGGTAGMTTGDRERRVTLPANFYRIHGVWCVQPSNAGNIMARVEGGTPQRWLWAPATEHRRRAGVQPRTAVAKPVYKIPHWNTGTNPIGPQGGALPELYSDGDPHPAPTWVTRNSSPQLQAWYAQAEQDRDAALDYDPYIKPTPEEAAQRHAVAMSSHSILTTIKVAVWMAWLHGRREPNDMDFFFASAQMEVSKAEAAGVWDTLSWGQEDELSVAGKRRGAEMHSADIARDVAAHTEVQRLADELWDRLAHEGPKPPRILRNGLSNRRKRLAKEARDLLEDMGRIQEDRHGYFWAFNAEGMPVAPIGTPLFQPRV